jgi:hypothetical protein
MIVRKIVDLGSDTIALVDQQTDNGYVYVTLMSPEFEQETFTRPAKSMQLAFSRNGEKLNAFIRALQSE